jgi:hypothetical protein
MSFAAILLVALMFLTIFVVNIYMQSGLGMEPVEAGLERASSTDSRGVDGWKSTPGSARPVYRSLEGH